jgi:hypothetical protein
MNMMMKEKSLAFGVAPTTCYVYAMTCYQWVYDGGRIEVCHTPIVDRHSQCSSSSHFSMLSFIPFFLIISSADSVWYDVLQVDLCRDSDRGAPRAYRRPLWHCFKIICFRFKNIC